MERKQNKDMISELFSGIHYSKNHTNIKIQERCKVREWKVHGTVNSDTMELW